MKQVQFSLGEYLVLRAAAQKYQEKNEAILRQCSFALRRNILKSIIDLDIAISRCDRRENSFPPDECKLLFIAVEYYRNILPPSSESAHLLIPGLLEKLQALEAQLEGEGMPAAEHMLQKAVPVGI